MDLRGAGEWYRFSVNRAKFEAAFWYKIYSPQARKFLTDDQ